MIISIWLLLIILSLTVFSQAYADPTSSSSIPGNCTEALRLSRGSEGIHTIRIPGSHLEPFDVYCLRSKNGTAYTIIQRRVDDSTDFERPWVDYVQGFGNLKNNFWIGLEKLHELTKSSVGDLWIQMEDFDNNKAWARYTDFVIGNATESFALKTLGSYEGNAGDALRYHADQTFSTKDVDNDLNTERNCAAFYKGAWWYKSCYYSNLNGKYGHGISQQGIIWHTWKEFRSLKYVQMAIRDSPYIPSNCTEAVRLSGRPYGIHRIRIPNSRLEPFDVYCESKQNGGVYTVIQRRVNDSIDFQKPWFDYVRGFGNLEGSFWIGLQKLHELTKSSGDLLIEMKDFDNNEAWARYTDFVIGNATELFALKTLGSYEGNAGDSLRYHAGQKFSTKDVDNDLNKRRNCAAFYRGAWWHKSCYYSNLNGKYLSDIVQEGIVWYEWKKQFYSLKYVQMAIRT